jgi:hypothetical protein
MKNCFVPGHGHICVKLRHSTPAPLRLPVSAFLSSLSCYSLPVILFPGRKKQDGSHGIQKKTQRRGGAEAGSRIIMTLSLMRVGTGTKQFFIHEVYRLFFLQHNIEKFIRDKEHFLNPPLLQEGCNIRMPLCCL